MISFDLEYWGKMQNSNIEKGEKIIRKYHRRRRIIGAGFFGITALSAISILVSLTGLDQDVSSIWRRMNPYKTDLLEKHKGVVIDLTMGRILISCTPNCLSPGTPALRIVSLRLTWPEINKDGTESSHAPARPVIAFVPPGPEVK